MGCCSSKNSSTGDSIHPVQDYSEIAKAKKDLHQMIKKQSSQVVSVNLSNLLVQANQKGSYPCHFVGLHFIHNYLMLVRESLIDKNGVLILDIRRSNPKTYNDLHVFKS